jgi:cytochrome P450 family 135
VADAATAAPERARRPATPAGAGGALPPGPRLPAPVQTYGIVARPVRFLESCRRRFGQTFTLRILRAGEMVFISDPPSLKQLFAADRRNTIAPGRNAVLEPVLGPRSVLLLERDDHLQRRKLMLPPFHGERMRAYEAVMARAAERAVAGWPVGERFPLHPSMQEITFEVILAAVFGVEDDARRAALGERLTEVLATTRSPFALGMTVERARGLPRFRRIARMLDESDEIMFAEIADRRADPDLGSREDILSMLVAARFDDGTAMSDAEVRDQLMTLLLAGHETTATALAWAFDLLFRAPDKLARLRDELAAGDDHEYVDAVVKETLRVRPVVPFVGRRLREPAQLGGHDLPAGTDVMPAILLTHTRADVYPDPYEFRPERFLDGNPETFGWIPFGGGTRRCIGAAFAELEMRVVLSTILRSATLRPATDRPERVVRRNVTLSPRGGTPAVLVDRL